jgi:hypothetical protein
MLPFRAAAENPKSTGRKEYGADRCSPKRLKAAPLYIFMQKYRKVFVTSKNKSKLICPSQMKAYSICKTDDGNYPPLASQQL